MYYLQSRYYDAQVGRFVNADEAGYIATLQKEKFFVNLYSYCTNDPISNIDSTGMFKIKAWIIAAALDSIFALLNCAMMASYLSFSVTIMMLSRSWWSLPFAKTLFGTVAKVFVYGFLNPILSAIRTVMWRIAGVALYFIGGKAIDKALSYLGDHLSAFISSLLSWGGLIAGLIDWISDGKLDGSIKV